MILKFLIPGILFALVHLAAADPRPNVVVIIGDDLGLQLGCYGQENVRTPNIDRLAHEGIRFTRAYVAASSCSPSRASLLTGLYPFQNGQRCLAQFDGCRMQTGTKTLVSVLRGSGYRCGSVGKIHVQPIPPFHSMVDIPQSRSYKSWSQPVRDFLQSSQGKPFFLWVGLSEAHRGFVEQFDGRPVNPISACDPLPFIQIDNANIRRDTALYLNGVMRLDDCVWSVVTELKRAGRSGDTMIIFLGDNGPPYARSKTTCYETGVRVPLIVKYPSAIVTTGTVNSLVSLTDVFPTILEETGTTVSCSLPGRSLSRLLRGQAEPNWRQWLIVAMDWHCPWEDCRRRSITDGRYKMIVNLFWPNVNRFGGDGEPTLNASKQSSVPYLVAEAYRRYSSPPMREFYDLQSDPHELINLADNPSTQLQQALMLKELAGWQRIHGDPEME